MGSTPDNRGDIAPGYSQSGTTPKRGHQIAGRTEQCGEQQHNIKK